MIDSSVPKPVKKLLLLDDNGKKKLEKRLSDIVETTAIPALESIQVSGIDSGAMPFTLKFASDTKDNFTNFVRSLCDSAYLILSEPFQKNFTFEQKITASAKNKALSSLQHFRKSLLENISHFTNNESDPKNNQLLIDKFKDVLEELGNGLHTKILAAANNVYEEHGSLSYQLPQSGTLSGKYLEIFVNGLQENIEKAKARDTIFYNALLNFSLTHDAVGKQDIERLLPPASEERDTFAQTISDLFFNTLHSRSFSLRKGVPGELDKMIELAKAEQRVSVSFDQALVIAKEEFAQETPFPLPCSYNSNSQKQYQNWLEDRADEIIDDIDNKVPEVLDRFKETLREKEELSASEVYTDIKNGKLYSDMHHAIKETVDFMYPDPNTLRKQEITNITENIILKAFNKCANNQPDVDTVSQHASGTISEPDKTWQKRVTPLITPEKPQSQQKSSIA